MAAASTIKRLPADWRKHDGSWHSGRFLVMRFFLSSALANFKGQVDNKEILLKYQIYWFPDSWIISDFSFVFLRKEEMPQVFLFFLRYKNVTRDRNPAIRLRLTGKTLSRRRRRCNKFCFHLKGESRAIQIEARIRVQTLRLPKISHQTLVPTRFPQTPGLLSTSSTPSSQH
jgi:hypothetical protein